MPALSSVFGRTSGARGEPKSSSRLEIREGLPWLVTGSGGTGLDFFLSPPTLLGTGNYGNVLCVYVRYDAFEPCWLEAFGIGSSSPSPSASFPLSPPFALKAVAKPSPDTDPKRAETLSRSIHSEIRILSMLRGHRNVVRLYGVIEDATHWYLLLELALGGELFHSMIERELQGGFGEDETAQIMHTVLSLIADLHHLGIAHRDLKPENLLLAMPGPVRPRELKLIDFGLSRTYDPAAGGPLFTDLVGSAYYLSPNVILRASGPESDEWSAGVIMHLLLVGDPPFYAEDDDTLFDQILFQRLPFLAEPCPPPWDTVSEGARDLLARLLQRDPRKRITAREALEHPWIRRHVAVGDRDGEAEDNSEDEYVLIEREEGQEPE